MRKNIRLSKAALIGLVAGSTLVVPVFALADTTPAPQATSWSSHQGVGGMHGRPGVFGTVSAINGSSLTVVRKAGPQGEPAVTYSVDASKATVTKAGTTSSISAIAVNDVVMVQGTVNGTSVVATAIRDGVMMGKGMGHGLQGPDGSEPVIAGNGQPVIGGSVTAINGSSLTVTNKSNVTYTIDVTKAVVQKAGATASLSSIAVGDSVIVQGSINGTNVAATTVMDRGVPPTTTASGNTTQNGGGFMGGIEGFFKKLFGFF